MVQRWQRDASETLSVYAGFASVTRRMYARGPTRKNGLSYEWTRSGSMSAGSKWRDSAAGCYLVLNV